MVCSCPGRPHPLILAAEYQRALAALAYVYRERTCLRSHAPFPRQMSITDMRARGNRPESPWSPAHPVRRKGGTFMFAKTALERVDDTVDYLDTTAVVEPQYRRAAKALVEMFLNSQLPNF